MFPSLPRPLLPTAALCLLAGCQALPPLPGQPTAGTAPPPQPGPAVESAPAPQAGPDPSLSAPDAPVPRTTVPATPAQPAPPAAPATPPASVPAAPLPAGLQNEAVKVMPAAMEWLKPAAWIDLPGWRKDDLKAAWPALLQSCSALQRQAAWRGVCLAAEELRNPDSELVRAFLQNRFAVYQVQQTEGGAEGLVTGYYEPLLRGSREPTPKYRFPLLAPPDDLLMVDLANLYPELRSLRLRGRLEGNRVVPYFTRGEIEAGGTPVKGREIAWVDDPIELFFLQVQGSGRLRLESGELMRVGYADQNGHPYRSIGRWLVERGELSLDKASMQGIKEWARKNPDRLPELLAANPSYVFFRELPAQDGGPIGSLGVPLTPERSLAVDPRAIPLGAPVWLDTQRPNAAEPLQRLMLAQDTGSAIRGNVRADFFWGFGDDAGHKAGAMKQKGRMWVLLPRDYPLAANGPNGKSGL